MQEVVKETSNHVETVKNGVTSVFGWLKTLWDRIDIKEWAQSIGGGSAEAVEAAIYFGSGFAIGFLFKKYFKFMLWVLIASFVFIKILEYNMVLEIDWDGVTSLLGFDSAADFSAIVNDIFSWIKTNWLIFISATAGFLIGYKLG